MWTQEVSGLCGRTTAVSRLCGEECDSNLDTCRSCPAHSTSHGAQYYPHPYSPYLKQGPNKDLDKPDLSLVHFVFEVHG